MTYEEQYKWARTAQRLNMDFDELMETDEFVNAFPDWDTRQNAVWDARAAQMSAQLVTVATEDVGSEIAKIVAAGFKIDRTVPPFAIPSDGFGDAEYVPGQTNIWYGLPDGVSE